MTIILTTHAKKRMAERAISFKQIQEAVEMPEYTVQKEHKIEAYKRYNDKMLKIVYANEDKYIKVISIMWK